MLSDFGLGDCLSAGVNKKHVRVNVDKSNAASFKFGRRTSANILREDDLQCERGRVSKWSIRERIWRFSPNFILEVVQDAVE
jgi:hypothetical protein